MRGPSVIHQIIDGEAVIIDLDRGVYYSLDGVGAAVWAELERGASVGEMAAALATRYAAPAADVESAVRRLLEEMAAEALIVEGGSRRDAPAPPAPATPGSFSAPVLRKYTDLQDLLLLDPIHQVDETGWPDRPAAERRAPAP